MPRALLLPMTQLPLVGRIAQAMDVLSLTTMLKKTATVILYLLLGLLASGCVAPSLLPVAAFTPSTDSGASPLIVTFDASASHAPNGVLTEYAWNFGDGSTGRGKIVSHSYQANAETQFTVTLQITDQQGQQTSTIGEVTVYPPSEPVEDSPSIEFVWPFHYDAEGDDAANLNDEYFTLRNTGDDSIDLSGWSIENDRGETFILPEGASLSLGANVTVHSGSGINSSAHLYLHAAAPIWADDSDLAILRDADGHIVAYYAIQSC